MEVKSLKKGKLIDKEEEKPEQIYIGAFKVAGREDEIKLLGLRSYDKNKFE